MSKAKMSRILDRVAVASQGHSQLRAWEHDRIQESSERDISEQPLHHQPALEPMEVEEAHPQQFGVQGRLALLLERQEYLQKALDAMEVAEPVTSCVDATHSSLPMKRIVHADDDSNEEDAVLVYCDICQTWLNGVWQWENHINGRKHKAKRLATSSSHRQCRSTS